MYVAKPVVEALRLHSHLHLRAVQVSTITRRSAQRENLLNQM
jgi:hypothetical protein